MPDNAQGPRPDPPGFASEPASGDPDHPTARLDEAAAFDPDQPAAHLAGPLGSGDPRFPDQPPRRPRQLVKSRGPGPSPEDDRVRLLRLGIRVVSIAGLLVIGTVFVVALRGESDPVADVGVEEVVRSAVADRPLRACPEGSGLPCVWLTEVDGELLALSTSGPLREEQGSEGVRWCPSSGHFGSDDTGSRYDAAGRPLSGSTPRGLDRYRVVRDGGRVAIDFGSPTAGLPAGRSFDEVAATGPDCDEWPSESVTELPIG